MLFFFKLLYILLLSHLSLKIIHDTLLKMKINRSKVNAMRWFEIFAKEIGFKNDFQSFFSSSIDATINPSYCFGAHLKFKFYVIFRTFLYRKDLSEFFMHEWLEMNSENLSQKFFPQCISGTLCLCATLCSSELKLF